MATDTITTIARPYAKAAFEFALKNDVLAEWSTFLEIASFVALDKHVAELIKTPGIPFERFAEIFIDVCGQFASNHGKNFIQLLAGNGRLVALPEIKVLFEALKSEQEKTVDVVVIGKHYLTDAQKVSLSEALEKRLSRKVSIHEEIDETLLGGAIIRAGDLVIDGSIRGKLTKLKAEIAA